MFHDPKRASGMARPMALFFLILSSVVASGQQSLKPPSGAATFKVPIFVTTCGQSPGALMVKIICRQTKIECIQDDQMTDDELAAKAKSGGTLFITTGTSGKGMGAAGVDLAGEVKRCERLVRKARGLGMRVIVGQIEGSSRRVDDSDEQSIRSMSPLADLLITRAEVDKDGYFTKVAAEKNIPQIFIEGTLDLTKVLPTLLIPK